MIVTVVKWLGLWFLSSLVVGIAVGKFLAWHNTPSLEELEPPKWVRQEKRAPIRTFPTNGSAVEPVGGPL